MKLQLTDEQMIKLNKAKDNTGLSKASIIGALIEDNIDSEGQPIIIEQYLTQKQQDMLPLSAQTTILGNPIVFAPEKEKPYQESDFKEVASNGWSLPLFTKMFNRKDKQTP